MSFPIYLRVRSEMDPQSVQFWRQSANILDFLGSITCSPYCNGFFQEPYIVLMSAVQQSER